jgi:hypothetical protein
VLDDKSVTCVAQLQKQLVIDAAVERAREHEQASGSATTGTDNHGNDVDELEAQDNTVVAVFE